VYGVRKDNGDDRRGREIEKRFEKVVEESEEGHFVKKKKKGVVRSP